MGAGFSQRSPTQEAMTHFHRLWLEVLKGTGQWKLPAWQYAGGLTRALDERDEALRRLFRADPTSYAELADIINSGSPLPAVEPSGGVQSEGQPLAGPPPDRQDPIPPSPVSSPPVDLSLGGNVSVNPVLVDPSSDGTSFEDHSFSGHPADNQVPVGPRSDGRLADDQVPVGPRPDGHPTGGHPGGGPAFADQVSAELDELLLGPPNPDGQS